MQRYWVVPLLLLLAMPAFAEEQSGVLSFTFDDSSKAQYIHAFPLMIEHGFSGTLYVVSGGVDAGTSGEDPFYMSWDNVREMYQAGWEIGSHTHTHAHLTTLSDMDLFAELAYAKRRIAEEIGGVPVGLAFPYGEFDARVSAEAKHHYAYHARAWGGNEGVNGLPHTDVYDVGRMDVQVTHSAQYICEVIARANSEGKWLVLIFHEVVVQNPSEYQVSVETLADILECTQVLVEQQGMRVLTVMDALTLGKGDH